MSDPESQSIPEESLSKAEPAALVCLPDDSAANIARLNPVTIRCSHDTDDPDATNLRRTIGDNETIPEEFAIVGDIKKPTGDIIEDLKDNWGGYKWETKGDKVEIITNGGPPPEVEGKELSVSHIDESGREVYVWEAPPQDFEVQDVFDGKLWRRLREGRKFELRRGGEVITTIVVYPPYQVLVKIKFPNVGSITKSNRKEVDLQEAASKAGKRLGDAVENEGINSFDDAVAKVKDSVRSSVDETTESSSSVKIEEWDPWSGDYSMVSTDGTTIYGESKYVDGVDVVVNGVELNKYKQLVDVFMSVGHMVEGIVDLIGSAPKFGWYVDTNIDLVSGEITIPWGWREYHDHQAFLWMAAYFNVTLFRLRLELGVGLDAFVAEAKIFVFIEGTSSIKFGAERKGPKQAPSFKAPFNNVVEGGVGGRAAVKHIIEGYAHGKTGIELRFSPKMDQDEGFYLRVELYWLGAEVTIGASIGPGEKGGKGSGGKITKEIFKRQKLGECEFPPGYEHEVEPSEIIKILEDELKVGRDVRVKNYGTGDVLGAEHVATDVARRIMRHPEIPRTSTVIQSIGKTVRQNLTPYFRGHLWSIKKVPYSIYLHFLHGTLVDADTKSLQEILDSHATDSLEPKTASK